MTRISAVESITLDGVMQAPGAPDEDTRGGFRHGGWAQPYSDEVQLRVMGEGMAREGGLLFGRRTYLSLMQAWAGRDDNPFSRAYSTPAASTSCRRRSRTRSRGRTRRSSQPTR